MNGLLPTFAHRNPQPPPTIIRLVLLIHRAPKPSPQPWAELPQLGQSVSADDGPPGQLRFGFV